MPKKLLPVSVGISNSSGILGEEETRRQTGKARNKLWEEVWIPPVLLIRQGSVRLPMQQCYFQCRYLCSVSKTFLQTNTWTRIQFEGQPSWKVQPMSDLKWEMSCLGYPTMRKVWTDGHLFELDQVIKSVTCSTLNLVGRSLSSDQLVENPNWTQYAIKPLLLQLEVDQNWN